MNYKNDLNQINYNNNNKIYMLHKNLDNRYLPVIADPQWTCWSFLTQRMFMTPARTIQHRWMNLSLITFYTGSDKNLQNLKNPYYLAQKNQFTGQTLNPQVPRKPEKIVCQKNHPRRKEKKPPPEKKNYFPPKSSWLKKKTMFHKKKILITTISAHRRGSPINTLILARPAVLEYLRAVKTIQPRWINSSSITFYTSKDENLTTALPPLRGPM